MPSRERLSYSFLHSTACGYQNFLRYEGKIKGPVTAPLLLGNSVHYALEKGHLTDNRTLDTFLTLFLDEHRRSVQDDDVFIAFPEIKQNENEGTNMLSRYWDHMQKGRIQQNPLAVEQEFELEIAGTKLQGKIDKVELQNDGYVVIDYKTGRREPESWFLRRNLQFTAYWFACKEIYGEYPVRAIWHHLRNGKQIETARTEWDITNLEQNIRETQAMLDQDMRRRIYHEKVCGWCPYMGSICDDPNLEQTILDRRNLPVVNPEQTLES
jgi:CRISPR/Cas system-associated exonuclease Cas4 (RecB family)